MSEVNKAIIRRVIDEGFNKHNIAVFAELYPSCLCHSSATGDLRGEAHKNFVDSILTAFPDSVETVQDQMAEGDKVMTRWTFTGTHKGMFMGIAATGRKITITGMCIDRIANGKIVEEWLEWDALGMMRQLGVVPEIKVAETVAA